MEFFKREIEAVLFTIQAFAPDGRIVAGLMMEDITLGTKRRLQKLREAMLVHHAEYEKDLKQIKEECKDDAVKETEEIKILGEEVIKVDQEFLRLDLIEAIQSKQVYDFSIIEKFAK